MNQIYRIIRENIDNYNTVFVFPAEISAAFWRKESLRFTDRNAVETERFLSWDRFKERNFQMFRDERPANALHRIIFAHLMLDENRLQGDLFQGIVSPQYAENSPAFLGFVVRLLPVLGLFTGVSAEGVDDGFFQTLRGLYHRYTEFLITHNLFEPGYEKPDLAEITDEVFIFFPELLDDFTEFADDLEGHPKITLVAGEKPEKTALRFRYFTNTLQEFEGLFVDIVGLLDAGVSCTDIAVTVADDSVLQYLLNSACRYSLPLSFRGGRKIVEYPAGKFFFLLKDCIDTGFHIEAIKKFFLSTSLPWKHRDQLEKIVLTLIDLMPIVDESIQPRQFGRLGRALRLSGDPVSADLLVSVQKGMRNIRNAKSFHELRQQFITFSTKFFSDFTDNEDRRVFEYILGAAGDIQKVLDNFDLQIRIAPFDLFLQYIQGMTYVPKGGNPGIPVYSYRVAAGIVPEYHFIVSAHHGATRVTSGSLNFLRKDQKERLGVSDREMGSHFLDAYILSGKKVFISCSADTFTGKTLVSPYFMDCLGILPEPESGDERGTCFTREQEFWGSAQGGPAAYEMTYLFPLQLEGITAIGDSLFRDRKIDFTRDEIQDVDLKKTLMKNYTKEGYLQISPTGLERFVHCPFAFLVHTAIDSSSRDFQSLYLPPFHVGRFLHESLRRLFLQLGEKEGKNVSEFSREQFGDISRETVEGVMKKYRAKGYVLLPPVEKELQGKAFRWLLSLFDLENANSFGWAEAVLEYELSAEIPLADTDPAASCVLRGKIDRLARADENWTVLDYKTTSRITKKQLRGEAGSPPESLQIPLYTYLAEKGGYKIARAGYISLSESRFIPLLKSDSDPKGWFSREEFEGLMIRGEEYAKQMTESLERGAFQTAEDCSPCTFRGICRVKYNVR